MIMCCFFIAFAILIITAAAVFKKRKFFGRAVRTVLIGTFFIVAVLIFPIYKQSNGVLTSIIFSLIYALGTLTAGQEVDLAQSAVIDGWLHYGYYGLLYFVFIIAPLFTTSFLISLFGNLADRIRCRFMLGDEVHVFSALTESTITLCESLAAKGRRFIFCNKELTAGDNDSDLVLRARAVNAIILSSPETDLTLRKKHIRFYQASDNKDRNINSAISLIEKYRGNSDSDIQITAVASGITPELLLDSIDKGNIHVKLIDDTKYMCYSLLDSVPLFTNAANNKISVLLVGCGYTGTEMLKAIIWCGQIPGYTLEINVVDIKADEIKKEFLRDCPAVSLEEYGIRFFKVDATSSDFEDVLNQYCNQTTYVIVSTGDDKLNIDTALFLRKHFLNIGAYNFSNKPIINLRVRDGSKNKQLDALSAANFESFALYAFGSIKNTFNADTLFNSPLEKSAIGVHLSYYRVLNGTEEEIAAAMESYYRKEYNQRSSFATALHIKYKMFACGIKDISGSQVTDSQIAEFEKCIQNPETLETLAKYEHSRWNAFMKTEGYSLASPQDVAVYHSLGKKPSHIHSLARLHPTIIPWEELDEMSKTISGIMNREFNFKDNDFYIVKCMPEILRAQKTNLSYWLEE